MIKDLTHQFDRQCPKLQQKKREGFGENLRSWDRSVTRQGLKTLRELLNQNSFLLIPMGGSGWGSDQDRFNNWQETFSYTELTQQLKLPRDKGSKGMSQLLR